VVDQHDTLGRIQWRRAEGREPLLCPRDGQAVRHRRCRLALKHAEAADLVVADVDQGVGTDTVDERCPRLLGVRVVKERRNR
jgi:hypothetical protein